MVIFYPPNCRDKSQISYSKKRPHFFERLTAYFLSFYFYLFNFFFFFFFFFCSWPKVGTLFLNEKVGFFKNFLLLLSLGLFMLNLCFLIFYFIHSFWMYEPRFTEWISIVTLSLAQLLTATQRKSLNHFFWEWIIKYNKVSIFVHFWYVSIKIAEISHENFWSILYPIIFI